jgi:hypothetical protein
MPSKYPLNNIFDYPIKGMSLDSESKNVKEIEPTAKYFIDRSAGKLYY